MPDSNIESHLKENFHGKVLRDISLKEYTSLNIGGRAGYLLMPEDPLSLKNLIDLLTERSIGYFIIGGGTNLLVLDGGVDKVLISLRSFHRLEIVEEHGDEVMVFAQAGLSLQGLVRFSGNEGLSGIEGLAGIPGTLGGALFGNAGSFGFEIHDVVRRITVIGGGGMSVIEGDEIRTSYRSGGVPGGITIVGAHFTLKRDDPLAVKKRTAGYIQQKKASQPLDKRSAGCVFKNPPDRSAGKLIDDAGCKGMRIGDIEVSGRHANFFINLGEGRAVDFLRLMNEVSGRVFDLHGIALVPEIRIIGRKPEESRAG